jgi:hypothetical protein
MLVTPPEAEQLEFVKVFANIVAFVLPPGIVGACQSVETTSGL